MPQLILAADDNPIIRTLVELTLLKAGFAVETFEDGASVLARLPTLAPDIVILDLDMPIIGGLETLRRIRAQYGALSPPILMLTGSEDVHDMIHARRQGAVGYLCKPFEASDLVTKVQQLLEDPDLVWMDDVTCVRKIATA